jgi:hypothetical protein
LVVIVAVFGGIRALALRNDLWMDELWTMWHLSQLRSVGEIFSRFIHDNNHPLNTLWMYAVMPLQLDWAHRLLSWAGGTAAVVLAAKVSRLHLQRLHPNAPARQVQAAELLAAALFGSSYLLTVYSSEARGYGPALGFGLLALYALWRPPATAFNRWVIVYWLAISLGLLAHAVSYPLLGAAVVYTVADSLERKTNARDVGRALARWHAAPVAFGLLYYVVFLRRLEVVGGPETPFSTVLGELAAYSIGFPISVSVSLALPLLLAGVAIALVCVWRRSRAVAAFHLTAMIAFPAVALALSPFVYLFPRYFILSAALALLLLVYVGALAMNAGRGARWLTLLALCGIAVGNLLHTTKLLRHGRGEYRAALRHIAARTPPGDITVSSDHDGRNVLLIYHHGPIAIAPRTLTYVPRTDLPPQGTQWLLVHRLDHAAVPAEELLDDRGNRYRRENVFLHAPLSGWDWYVYRSLRLLP